MIYRNAEFQIAKPVFAAGLSKEMNVAVLFTAEITKGEGTVLRMAGHCSYELFINGSFVHYGPARAGRNHYRVDELPMDAWLVNDINRVSVIVSGYNCGCFHYFNEESFFCAEFVRDGSAFCATGCGEWTLSLFDEKVKKVQRYSFQRTFAECYDYRSHSDRLWHTGRVICSEELRPEKVFIEREVSLPEFPYEAASRFLECGNVAYSEPEKYLKTSLIENMGKKYGNPGYAREECRMPIHEVQRMVLNAHGKTDALPLDLGADRYALLAFAGERTGLFQLEVSCESDCDIYVTFDEVLRNGQVDPTRMNCTNVLTWKLPAGRHILLTAEPYSMQYLNVIVCGNPAKILSVGMIRTDFNASEINVFLNKTKADAEIARIYEAAVETFRQNTLDIYMDCPSRERAGWLCDSFFTSRVEYLLTGTCRVEHAFLSNFAMERHFDTLPEGMLPMCYPAESYGAYIPNWAMWYFIELSEYVVRSGDREFADEVRDMAYALLGCMKRYENADGLLEKLEGWVFLEWSKSNELVQDINYPTNMLYYRFKKVLAALYDDAELSCEADALRLQIRKESLGELFFCDNSVYGDDGVARLSGEVTESCQYYAFFTGVATPDEDARLWKTLLEDFGPERKQTGKWANVYFANAFIGNYLRCELLMREGELAALETNIRGYFDYMAQKTGTLWENDQDYASCNHGFASHVLIWLDKLGYICRNL